MSRSTNRRQLITLTNPRSPVSESYRTLRTNIEFTSIDEKLQVMMVTSAGPGEGKSTTIANLAVTFSQADRKVILVDADLRKPTAHKTFFLSNRWGLSSVIAQKCSLQESIQDTDVPNLSVLTAGPIPPNPAEIMASKRMTALIEELRGLYDIVLIDSPPLLAVTDAQIISTKSDGVVMVIDQGSVKREIAKKAIDNLHHVNARILGVVLNNVKRKASEESYYYYYGHDDK